MIVDASIVVASLLDARYAESYAGSNVAAPDLIVAESLNAFWKMNRAAVGMPDLATVYAALDDIVLESSRLLAARAWKIALELDHPVYDCMYLALAERDDDVLVTRDARLHRKVTGNTLGARVQLF